MRWSSCSASLSCALAVTVLALNSASSAVLRSRSLVSMSDSSAISTSPLLTRVPTSAWISATAPRTRAATTPALRAIMRPYTGRVSVIWLRVTASTTNVERPLPAALPFAGAPVAPSGLPSGRVPRGVEGGVEEGAAAPVLPAACANTGKEKPDRHRAAATTAADAVCKGEMPIIRMFPERRNSQYSVRFRTYSASSVRA